MVAVGKGFTVTNAVFVDEQPLIVAVTVYVVVTDGDAVTLLVLVELKPAAGLHDQFGFREGKLPPLAEIFSEAPAHNVINEDDKVTGSGFGITINVLVAVAVHDPPLVTVTV